MKKSIHADPDQALRAWLKAHRKAKKMTQRELAKIIDEDHTWVVRVENGERRLDVVEFLRLCMIFQANPHEIVDRLLLMDIITKHAPPWEEEKAAAAETIVKPYRIGK
jgi:transcriptional regulator with XRE-family HTH domain